MVKCYKLQITFRRYKSHFLKSVKNHKKFPLELTKLLATGFNQLVFGLFCTTQQKSFISLDNIV